MNALSNLNGQASNPSGVAVCHYLPFLDNQTDVFQAELLSYLGATVQKMAGSFTKRNLD